MVDMVKARERQPECAASRYAAVETVEREPNSDLADQVRIEASSEEGLLLHFLI